jgi:hypothetical protein
MTIHTTPPTPAEPQPAPHPVPADFDWRQLDFAADGLVLRRTLDAKG